LRLRKDFRKILQHPHLVGARAPPPVSTSAFSLDCLLGLHRLTKPSTAALMTLRMSFLTVFRQSHSSAHHVCYPS
jgi:hypothetical protein